MIPKGWTEVALGDLLEDIHPGFASGEQTKNGVVQVRMNNVTLDGRLDLQTRRRVPASAKQLDKYRLRPGDVLFNATNSAELVGKTAYFSGLDEPVVFSNHFLRLRARKAELEPAYLTRWLHYQFQRRVFAVRSRQWVNQATFDRTALARLPMLVPPLAEQRRIVAVLDKADKLRARQRAAVSEATSWDEALLRRIFGDPVSNPMGWPGSEVLSDVAQIASGITKGRRLNGGSTRTVPYLAVANVQDRRLDLELVKTIDATESEIARFSLLKGDLLLTEGGDPDKLGRGTVWQDEIPGCIHQNHIFRVRITSEAYEPLFVSRLVASARGRRYFMRAAKQTTGIASINKHQLGRFPMLRPPVELQRKFVRILQQRQRVLGLEEAMLGRLDELFMSLQQRAFRGEL